MTDEPTLGELSRIIQSMRQDIREDFAAMGARLDRLVPLDVYRADQRTTEQRIAVLEQRATAAEQRAERRPERVIAVIAAVVAVVSVLVQVYSATRGTGG